MEAETYCGSGNILWKRRKVVLYESSVIGFYGKEASNPSATYITRGRGCEILCTDTELHTALGAVKL